MPCLLSVGLLLSHNDPTAAEARLFHYISKKCKGKSKGKGEGKGEGKGKGKGEGAAVKGAATDNMRLRGLTVEARTHAGPSGLLQKNLSGEADSKSPWETSQGKQGIADGRQIYSHRGMRSSKSHGAGGLPGSLSCKKFRSRNCAVFREALEISAHTSFQGAMTPSVLLETLPTA